MKYMGSKNRIAKHILPIMLKEMEDKGYTTWVEPFVGGGNMIDKVPDKYKRIGADLNEYVIAFWNALVYSDWVPPTSISEEEYKHIKQNKDSYPKEIVGFTGIAVTFGSTWFGTYARNSRGTNYAMEGRKNLIKQAMRLKGVEFIHSSYECSVFGGNSIVYCDPPYNGVSGYKDKFDSDKFFAWCREMKSKGNSVFVSEYSAPDDFELVWQGEVKKSLNNTSNTTTGNAVEKLFKV